MTALSIFTFLTIFFLLSLVLGLYLKLQEERKKNENNLSEREDKKVLKKINSKSSETKNERKEEILEILKEKGKITNNDVEEILGVSDPTATNYLSELEEEGKIVQVGETGKGVYYELNG